MLKRKSSYFELGPDYLEEKKKQAIIPQIVKKLEKFGLKVTVESFAYKQHLILIP
jgi:transposase